MSIISVCYGNIVLTKSIAEIRKHVDLLQQILTGQETWAIRESDRLETNPNQQFIQITFVISLHVTGKYWEWVYKLLLAVYVA